MEAIRKSAFLAGYIVPATKTRLGKTPRVKPLKVRKKMLVAKLRAAGVKTPMALSQVKERK